MVTRIKKIKECDGKYMHHVLLEMLRSKSKIHVKMYTLNEHFHVIKCSCHTIFFTFRLLQSHQMG